jgi:hypothetical protein
MRLKLRNLDPNTTYTVYTYHAWDDGDFNSADPVTIEGADSNYIINKPQVVITTSDEDLLEHADVGEIQFTTDGSGSEVRIKFNGCVKFNAFELLSEAAVPVATGPNPSGTDICPTALQLFWTPGADVNDANGHDVYFGTDYNDVRDANRESHPGVLYYSLGQDSNEYPEEGDSLLDLDLMTTYYWRVDEINDTNTWTGPIWSFTTEDGNAHDPEPLDGFIGLDPDANVLSWTPSCVATSQDVYFSTDFNDVNTLHGDALYATVGPAENNVTATIEKFTTYYWRVRTTGGGDGEVWTFKTGLGGLLLDMQFDGVLGEDLPATEPDSSDNGLDFTTYEDDGSLKYADGRYAGTSVAIDRNACLYRAGTGENDPLLLAGWQYTIEMWAYLPAAAYTEEQATYMIVGKPTGWRISIHDPGQEGDIRYYHKQYEKIHAVMVEGILPEIFDEWVHIAAVFDKIAPTPQKLYIDGTVVATYNYRGTTYADNNTPVGIGAKVQGPPYSFDWYSEGRIDELRIWDIALEPQIKSATQPYPPDWSRDWDPNDPNLDTFTWKPGAYADKHDIYFGTSLDDVNESANPNVPDWDSNSWPHGKEFEAGKTYYWRVDEVNGLDIWTGSIWKFQTRFDIVDPNMIVWYKFDETSGIDVTDSSGHANHGELAAFAGLHEIWDPCDGRFPGCISFHAEEGERIDIDSDVFDYIGDSISISVWWKDAYRHDNENEFCGFGDADDDDDDPNDLQLLVRGPDNRPDNLGVIWQAGNDSNDYLEWDVDTLAWQSNWHHLVFTKNGPEGTMKIYFDTVLVAWTYDAKGTTLSQTADDEKDGFNIGSNWENGDSFVGKADDFRVYDYEIPQSKIDELCRGGDLGYAWSPSPYDGQPDAPRDANLVWNAGDYASDHNVFFGTSWEDVNAMTDPCATKSLGDESYDLPILDLATTYYWRVDEHNDPCTWRGPIWRFTVADYIILDNFESYDDTDDLTLVWVDYTRQPDPTGAQLRLGESPYYEAHSGNKVMRYGYDNRFTWASYPHSEAWLPLSGNKKNWEDPGVRALTLFFYGLPINAPTETEQMYIGIDDENGTYAEIRYGDYRGEDINDLNEPEWHDWFVALPDFNDSNYAAVAADVDFSDVNTFYIGFGDKQNPQIGGVGEVRFDDIRLYLPTCQPDIIKPVGDFTGRRGVPDCVVDWWDIRFFVENEWLKTDANYVDVATEPNHANLVGHWALDGDPGDSSTYDHNSTIEGSFSWVVGHANDLNPGDGAVQFTGSGGRIRVDPCEVLRPKYAVTASAWVYFTEEQDDARVVVKGNEGKETYLIEVDDYDTFQFKVRDVCDTDWDVRDEESVYPYEWIHLAGTFDGDTNTVKAYVNAELIKSRKDANFVTAGRTLCQDTNDLAIGSRAEELADTFEGAIDEVRVYNYALDANEIAWLATDGTGFIRLRSQANFYDLEPPGEKVVNFRDIAKLIAEHWLEEKKWP